MLITLFGDLKRRRQIENLLAMLNCDHPPGGERPAVAGPIHLEYDRHAGVTRADEVAVQGMAKPVFDGFIGRKQGLRDHLAAKDTARPVIAADPAKQIYLKTL